MMFFIFSYYSVDLERLMYTYVTILHVLWNKTIWATVSNNFILGSLRMELPCRSIDDYDVHACIYYFLTQFVFFKLWHPCKVCNKKSVLYIIIVHIPVQNFTCIITFIVHHQKFSVFCIFTLHALFLLLFFTCNEMSKVHKICLYLINKHSCYIGILFVLQ